MGRVNKTLQKIAQKGLENQENTERQQQRAKEIKQRLRKRKDAISVFNGLDGVPRLSPQPPSKRARRYLGEDVNVLPDSSNLLVAGGLMLLCSFAFILFRRLSRSSTSQIKSWEARAMGDDSHKRR